MAPSGQVDGRQILIWSAFPDEHENELPEFLATLSPLERERAERFRLARDRQRYIIRHGILRVILGDYLGRHPSEIAFAYGPCGKPEVPESVHFTMSHSAGLAVYAVSRACSVGVDVEYLRDISDVAGIAARVFTLNEMESLQATPAASRIRKFYECWTRMEALGKAIGVGLSDTCPPAGGWEIRSFSPVHGWLAAVAFSERDSNLVFRTFHI